MNGASETADGVDLSTKNMDNTASISPSTERLISVVAPENEDGNIEYKRQLLNCTTNRLEKLKTQMSFRLDEGHGSCIYRIGVEDDGCHSLIDYDACAKTAKVLEYLARSLNAVVVERKMIQNEIMYSTIDGDATLSSRNIRVAVVGNVDAGKSTLIGTLTSSLLDDGRGSSRTSIMKHRHEIESGRTSTASTHLMGFRSTGEAIAGKDSIRANRRRSEDEVARESYRVVTLMDLAGHEKYLKTTIHGVASGMADYALVLVNSRHPPTHMTHHHLNLCVSFGIHVIIVFTKIDGCPEHAFKDSKAEVGKLLRRPDVGKQPFEIRSEDDITTCIGKLGTLVPMISTSCVTGEGVELLQKLLFSLPKRRRHEKKLKRSFEYLVDDIFNVPGVGSVVSGFVNAGQLDIGPNAHVYVGPTDDGSFMKCVAKSAHIARINTAHVTSGQSACLALALSKDSRKKLRRGMVVLSETPTSTTSTREFEAEICVLKGEGTTIRKSYQAFVHILNVRQSAYARKIEIVDNNALGLSTTHTALYGEENEIVLRPGCRAKVTFKFAKRPEYVRPGMRMLFRDGRVRGVGLVTAIPTVQPVH
ncbi:P-loop containing nucleoside triphosphate hydrolase protein [Fragilariopsis cylindrus CCMP1102]|uniref:Elongation factor Tu, chloroplastic n=1 Tax=Fragilariopsis cylindrus CCMP1102 TaxID=635003 RepID=A0A1E7FKQ0_9STRA|nr:P-loop containing nucleoside triphosphate hydrolase protein [Fragilariopsis cylindrus CCMP1102]|eukprot:OEU18750.1 P-loop containing nucleoside triphosphate hydrolase protein [Fragilariopsis cylindrus CCMP1102]